MRDPWTGDKIYLFTIRTTSWEAASGNIREQHDRTIWARNREEAIQVAWDRDPYAHSFEDVTEEVAITEERN